MFYLGSLALFGVSTILIREASPCSRSCCFVYEKKRKWRVVGQMLLAMAIVALGLGMLSQYISSHS